MEKQADTIIQMEDGLSGESEDEKTKQTVVSDPLVLSARLGLDTKEPDIDWGDTFGYGVLATERLRRSQAFRGARLGYHSNSSDRKVRNPITIEIDLLDRLFSGLITDELTQLFNWRFFKHTLSREIDRAKRYNLDLSLLLLDLDNFKECNDRFGHPFGDSVLSGVARILKNSFREVDLVFRFGGEEFAVILPETPAQTTLFAAERARRKVEEARFDCQGSKVAVSVTISGGIATLVSHTETPDELASEADKALYRAKEDGKNRIYVGPHIR